MSLLTANDCLKVFGDAKLEASLTIWNVPPELHIKTMPKKIYCNKLLIKPLSIALQSLKANGLDEQLKTWDGCFNIRTKRGATTSSLHSWGVAIDINAAWNGFNKPPTMGEAFVNCFKNAGFDWGGEWKKPDGMHFQLKRTLVVT